MAQYLVTYENDAETSYTVEAANWQAAIDEARWLWICECGCAAGEEEEQEVRSVTKIGPSRREMALLALVQAAQKALSTYLPPDSGISEHDVVNAMLSIFDGPEYRAAMRS